MRESQQKWTETQIKYAQFVARKKKALNGERRSDEEFAQANGVNRTTLWKWMQKPEYKQLVLECIIADKLPELPEMADAQIAAAKGVPRYFKDRNGKLREATPNTQAFNAIAKLMGMVQDRQQVESTVAMDAKVEAHVFHSDLSDDELDKLIENAR